MVTIITRSFEDNELIDEWMQETEGVENIKAADLKKVLKEALGKINIWGECFNVKYIRKNK